MAEFTPVKMERKRDGAKRTVTTAAEQVAAAFDGFVAAPQRTAAKKTTAAKKATAKVAATKAAAATPTGTAVTDGATGK